jgi:hypothetical protein
MWRRDARERGRAGMFSRYMRVDCRTKAIVQTVLFSCKNIDGGMPFEMPIVKREKMPFQSIDDCRQQDKRATFAT